VLDEQTQPPWASEFLYKLFYVDIPGNAGPVSEAAFFHRPSKTVVVTDAVVFVTPKPPPSRIFESLYGEAAQAADFWPKSVLQAVFLPLRQDESGAWPGFERIRGRLLRAPILRAFGDPRAPEETRAWVERICDGEWQFERVISGHFASPIRATPADFKEAFGSLFGNSLVLEEPDWKPLDDLNDLIETQKLGAPLKASYR
jgi:hypothetical protein